MVKSVRERMKRNEKTKVATKTEMVPLLWSFRAVIGVGNGG